jgi:hypothetical protein
VLLPDFEKRKNLMKIIFENFFENGNYQRKETFLHFADHSLEVFSRPAYKFFILNKIFALSNTEIESTLILIIKMLPRLSLILDPIKDQQDIERIKVIKKDLEDRGVKRIKDELRTTNNLM